MPVLITQKPCCPAWHACLGAGSHGMISLQLPTLGLAWVAVTRSFSTGQQALQILSRPSHVHWIGDEGSCLLFTAMGEAQVSCEHGMKSTWEEGCRWGLPLAHPCRTCSVTGQSTGEYTVPSEPLGRDLIRTFHP